MKHIFEYLINRKLTNKDANKHQICNYEVVDLDLPSGLKWATCNIGADAPEEPGLLFQWGRVDGYKYDDNNHKFLSEEDYTTTSSTKYKKGDVLNQEDDAAYQASNSWFRMPTTDEMDELLKHTDNKWTKLNGVNGMMFISKKDKDKWIFIPISGAFLDGSFKYNNCYCYVWSSSLHSNHLDFAYYLDCHNNFCSCFYSTRYDGFAVRGVRK